MKDFLQPFVNPSFMPHGHCYLWQPDILWTHVLSDLVITLAYYMIPIILAIFLFKRKKAIVFPEIILLFVAFIFLCGTTHLVSVYVTWVPLYEQQGWIKAITALISITTGVVLIPKLPKLITLPGIQEAYEKSQEALRKVESEKAEMKSIYDMSIGRESRILALKEEVNLLLSEQGKPQKYLLDETEKP